MRRTTMSLTAALLATLAWPGPILGETGSSTAPVTDPFKTTAAGQDAGASAAASVNPFRPQAPSSDRYAAPAAAPPADETAGQPSRRAQCDQALLAARRALSVGDLPRAQQFMGQAEQLKVAYDGSGDSPQSVAESIREYQELTVLRASKDGAAAWRQAYAKFLVTQADALLAWNDLDSASRAANEAAQLNPQFGAADVTPQDVLRRIKLKQEGRQNLANVAGAPAPLAGAKAQTLALLAHARAALTAGNLPQAEALAGKASALNVPDSQFSPQEDRPARLAADLQQARAESQTLLPAVLTLPTTATPGAADYVQAAAGAIDGDSPHLLAQFGDDAMPLPLPSADEALPLPGGSQQMLEAGEQALRAGDRAGALESFRAAFEKRDQLDVLSQQRLQGHLQMLSAGPSNERLPAPGGALLDSAAAGQTVVARQLSADILKRQLEAARMRQRDPNKSMTMLRESRAMVEDSDLSEGLKKQLLSRVDLSIGETEKYIKDHKAELELDATNREILDEIDRERVVKVEVQQRTAEMVDEFNKLADEHRYAEAEAVAKKLYDMSPDELVAQQIWKQAKMIRRERWNHDIIEKSEDGVATAFLDIRDTAANALANADTDITYGTNWDAIRDRKSSTELNNQRHIKELEIEQKLRTPVDVKYDETPLTKVVESLSQLAGVNIHLDPRGLEQEGIRSDTPVTLNLPHEISLKSALILVLEPLHLTYTISDEVLKITSEQIRDGDVKQVVYPVGDLVIPIPNFVPSNNMGLQGLINDAYASMGYGPSGGNGGPIAVVANRRPGQAGGAVGDNVMAQQFGPGGPQSGGSMPMNSGPGGLGGAASADFDSLIDLIISTVEHETWMENGTGEGEIMPFPTNLSLVISQTQRVHEQIADLLEQLRRLQDLQVTIEVRFIRLTDQFFERIGVDFDFDIADRTGLSPALFPTDGSAPAPQVAASATVGLGAAETAGNPNFSVDLDLPFRNSSFGLATPQFGVPQDIGTFGFAILSDLEAYFVINASQGDRRANILQAPKVTLFNGQQAFVVDSAFRPFVISVIPVVGEFAAAQQPVIVVLSEGTMMTVQAIVSDDRRYVRLTLVPFFSNIGNVQEFTFEGSETTSSSSGETDEDDDGNDETNEEAEEVTRSGTTVQLPTFEVISVATTVSVPDGGTVLLGGIKRLQEGRNEFGVPLLSKVPYIDRLFRNVGIGRDTDSLMMMVTPHIIIQEEEEDRLGIDTE